MGQLGLHTINSKSYPKAHRYSAPVTVRGSLCNTMCYIINRAAVNLWNEFLMNKQTESCLHSFCSSGSCVQFPPCQWFELPCLLLCDVNHFKWLYNENHKYTPNNEAIRTIPVFFAYFSPFSINNLCLHFWQLLFKPWSTVLGLI